MDKYYAQSYESFSKEHREMVFEGSLDDELVQLYHSLLLRWYDYRCLVELWKENFRPSVLWLYGILYAVFSFVILGGVRWYTLSTMIWDHVGAGLMIAGGVVAVVSTVMGQFVEPYIKGREQIPNRDRASALVRELKTYLLNERKVPEEQLRTQYAELVRDVP